MSGGAEEEEEEEGGGAAATAGRRYRVGYALAPKKVESFIKPSLLNHTKQRGIDLIPIDLNVPLIHQGPFDCLLHKLSGPHWIQQLRDYSSQNPNVPVIDPPEAIDRLHNRLSMLQVVDDLNFQIKESSQSDSDSDCSFGIPHQIFVPGSHLLVAALPIKFPVIAKPLVADGTANSHQMSLVFNQQGLEGLEAPVVLQEFVNHGGVVFKVYVVGNYVQCVKRRSLPDISFSAKQFGDSHNLLTFSQISNLAAAPPPHNNSNDNDDDSCSISSSEMPPVSSLADLAHALRNALGLHLFNFDVIRDSRYGNRYLVIDINYFPGYAKMPSYESVLADFFLDILHHNKR